MDRQQLSRALAKAIAFADVNKNAEASKWLHVIINAFKAKGIW